MPTDKSMRELIEDYANSITLCLSKSQAKRIGIQKLDDLLTQIRQKLCKSINDIESSYEKGSIKDMAFYIGIGKVLRVIIDEFKGGE